MDERSYSIMNKPSVFFAVVVMVVAFTASAMAEEWSFYGSARMRTFSESTSKDATGTGFDDQDTEWSLQGNSRFGAQVKSGDVAGRLEYGTRVNLRRLNGTWKFGSGELLVGQDYTPTDFTYSGQVGLGDNGLAGFGALGSRKPMIQLKMGGLKLAMVSPNTDDADNLAGTEYDSTLPKVEVRYDRSFGGLALAVLGGYQQYDIVDAADKGYGITSNVVGIGVKADLGAAFVAGGLFYGQNLTAYDIDATGTGSDSTADYIAASDGIKDNTGYGYHAVFGYKFSDKLKIEVGYGGVSYKDDTTGAKDDEASSYYVQVPVTLAKSVYIIPEAGEFDYQKDGTGAKEGDLTYFGAKWQINF
jgi:hypothetical protein